MPTLPLCAFAALLQKCALQTAVPIEVSARLAQHTVDEAKRYATNSTFEMADITAAPLKLVRTLLHPLAAGSRTCCCLAANSPLLRRLHAAVRPPCAQASPEWSSVKDPMPAPLAPRGSIYGVPYDAELFATGATAIPAAAAAPAARVAAMLDSAPMQSSAAQIGAFISSYASRTDLNGLLHAPALQKGSSSAEGLAVQLLRTIEGAVHLRSPDSSIAELTSRLPSISAAGLAAPAADRLVRPELAAVYVQLAADIQQLSARLQGSPAAVVGQRQQGLPS